MNYKNYNDSLKLLTKIQKYKIKTYMMFNIIRYFWKVSRALNSKAYSFTY